jgi:hypothetical protein
MEKKNKHNDGFIGGDCVPSNDALTTGCEEKGKEVKGSEKKGKEVNTTFTSFTTFWQAYPKRKRSSMGQAEKAWKKIKEPKKTLALILEALAWQKETEDWTKEGGQYIPLPASYLNAKKWLDEKVEKAVARNPFEE